MNHESLDSYLLYGRGRNDQKTEEQVLLEQRAVGGSILRVRKQSGSWRVVTDDPINRRIDGATKIPIAAARPIEGSLEARGTLANCAGGVTPWRTFLTCEENYFKFYGEVYFKDGKRSLSTGADRFQWRKYFECPPEHYGWVVEVKPETGACKKLTSLGRFSHECATTILTRDGRCVVYTGDDENDECLYKFIASEPGQLEKGVLHVASLEQKRWLPLDREQNPELHKKFADQTQLLIQTREAAHLVGGSRLARPEDIEIDPKTGHVYVSLTNNYPKKDYFGSILKIVENGNDPASLTFESETFLTGGPDSGFACPDNMVFDQAGNLWLTCDISESSQNREPFIGFGNNGLFYIPIRGPHAGGVFQIASAPNDAELTGPCFSPDGKTLFLSVQHPGSRSKIVGHYTSNWPEGGDAKPRGSVVTIQGPLLERLTGVS